MRVGFSFHYNLYIIIHIRILSVGTYLHRPCSFCRVFDYGLGRARKSRLDTHVPPACRFSPAASTDAGRVSSPVTGGRARSRGRDPINGHYYTGIFSIRFFFFVFYRIIIIIIMRTRTHTIASTRVLKIVRRRILL